MKFFTHTHKRSQKSGILITAIIVVGMLCQPINAKTTEAEKLTGFLPENTLMFNVTDGGDLLKDSFNASSLGKIWHEASVQEFYAQIKCALSKIIETNITFSDGSCEKKDATDVLELCKMLLAGPTLIGSSQIDNSKVPFNFFLVSKAKKDREKIDGMVGCMIDKADADDAPSIITIGDVKVNYITDEDDLPLHWGWIGDFFVVSVNDPNATIFRKMTSAKLSDLTSKPFDSIKQTGDKTDLVIKYFDFERTKKLFFKAMADENKITAEQTKKVKDILKLLGLDQLKTMSARAYFSKADMIANASLDTSESKAGIFQTIKAVDLSELNSVPENAIDLCMINIDFAKLFDLVMDAIKTADTKTHEEATKCIADFEKEAKLKIRKDIAENLAGPIVIYELPSNNMFGSMGANVIMKAKLKDSSRSAETLKTAMELLKVRGEALVQISEKDIAGYTCYTIMCPQLAMVQMTPTVMIAGDTLIVGSTTPGVMAAMKTTTRPAQNQSISQNAKFKSVAANLPEDILYFRYINQKIKGQQLMQSLQQFWPMLVMVLNQQDSEMNLPMMLPPSEDITKHLGVSTEYWWRDSDGFKYHGQGAVLSGNIEAGVIVGAALGTIFAKPMTVTTCDEPCEETSTETSEEKPTCDGPGNTCEIK